jgi:hypothetical protein
MIINVKSRDFLKDILAEWKINCNHQHSKITFFSLPPSPSSPPLQYAFDLAKKSLHFVVIHYGWFPDNENSLFLIQGSWQDLLHYRGLQTTKNEKCNCHNIGIS